MTGTKNIQIIRRGIYRKVLCPNSDREVELFYDCGGCRDYRGISSDGKFVQCGFGTEDMGTRYPYGKVLDTHKVRAHLLKIMADFPYDVGKVAAEMENRINAGEFYPDK